MSGSDSFSIEDRIYGKADVRLVHVKRVTRFEHIVHDLRVNVLIKLATEIDYTTGDNRDVVATDTTKNTVYVLAKKLGVESMEKFALDIASHYFSQYSHVLYIDVAIDGNIWRRVTAAESAGGSHDHSHAFVKSGEGLRTCRVRQFRNEQPRLTCGIKDLEIMKTTQSGFEGYYKDKFTTLKESNDRIFRTVVTCECELSTTNNVDFNSLHQSIKRALLREFAGPTDKGVYSPSVQNTIYLAQQNILKSVPQVSKVFVEMPNRHCIPVDLSPFGLKNDNEVYVATSEPSGLIRATCVRKPTSKL